MTEFEKRTAIEKWLGKEKRSPVVAHRLRSHVEAKELYSANIYHLPLSLLFQPLVPEADKEAAESMVEIVEATDTNKKGLTCLLCGLLFSNHSEQVEHFKSSFHYFNLQRKSKNRPVLSLEEYTAREISDLEKEVEQELEMTGSEDEKEEADVGSDEDHDSSSEKEDSEEEIVVETEYDRYEYQDDQGKVTKVFPTMTGPIFNVALKALSPWEFTLSLAMFPKASSFQSKSWNLTSPTDLSHPSGDDNQALWNRLHLHLSHLQNQPLTAIFILRSGRFAGAIFDNRKVLSAKASLLAHKVIRRYTVRAKAGGKQSSHDNKNSKARSVGAMLRRYGERALQEDIQDIFTQWRDYLQCCGLILIASTKSMRYQLFKENEDAGGSSINTNTANSGSSPESNLLSRDDPRVSFVPFVVDRPTLESIHLIREKSTQVLFHKNLLDVIAPRSIAERKGDSNVLNTNINVSNQKKEGMTVKTVGKDSIENELLSSFLVSDHTRAIFQIIESSTQDVEAKERLQKYLDDYFVAEVSLTNSTNDDENDSNSSSSSDSEPESDEKSSLKKKKKGYFGNRIFISRDQREDLARIINHPISVDTLTTPLHLASSKSFPMTIESLLYHQANPEVLDSHGRTPYYLASNKATRDIFRVMKGKLGKHTWDWSKTGIPQEITDASIQQQKEKEKAKKKKKQLKKKEKKAAQKETLKQDEAFAKELQEQEELRYLQELQQQEYLGGGSGGGRTNTTSAAPTTTRRGGPPVTAPLLLTLCDQCHKEIKSRRDMHDLFHQYKLCSPQCLQLMKRKLAADAAMNRFHA